MVGRSSGVLSGVKVVERLDIRIIVFYDIGAYDTSVNRRRAEHEVDAVVIVVGRRNELVGVFFMHNVKIRRIIKDIRNTP